METVQFNQRRWLRATLALAVVLASVDRTFTNYTSKVLRYPAIAAVSKTADALEQPRNLEDGDVLLEQPRNLEGLDEDVDLDEEVKPYDDWEEAEREVSSLLEQTEGLDNMVRSSQTFMEKLDRLEDELQPADRARLEDETMQPSRENMVEAIHRTLAKGYRRLNSAAMRQFAEMTGFEGNHAAWSVEYELLCAELDCVCREGLTVEHLLCLVSDTSDLGTYYSDEELESICNALGADPQQPPQQEKRHRFRSKSSFKKKTAWRSARRDPWA